MALPPERRAAFVRDACGPDAALCATLGALVEDASDARAFIDGVAGPAVARLTAAAVGSAPELLPGEQVAHFRILEAIGGGGMGRVHRALDLRLGRVVALKFLPPLLGADEGAKRRFVDEARAASALDHPNVCAIHEIGETAGGRPFIAMASYDGETVKQKLARGALPPHEAIEYGAQIADGLQAAHAAGIVHRDVKPANVMITARGQAKILDFGVAMTTAAGCGGDGAAVGTIAYMSPEQTRGDPVDARGDVWSLGAVLFEMLTGRRPFHGATERAVVDAIRHVAPPRADRLRPDIPAAVAALVERCLEKDAARRPESAGELLRELRAAQSGLATARAARRRARLRAGLTALAASLAASLAVIGLAARARVAPTAPRAITSRAAHRVNPEALALYLQSARVADNARKREYLEQAIAKDSLFAPAYAQVAHAYMWLGDKAKAERAIAKALALDPSLSEAYDALGLLRMWRDWNWPAAEAALRRSIELNPHNPKAHHELGQLLMRVRRCDEAVVETQREMMESPREAYGQGGLAEVYLFCRRYDDAIREFEKTLSLARDSSAIYFNMGDAYFFQHRYDDALAMYRRARWVPGWAWARAGDRREASWQAESLAVEFARTGRNYWIAWTVARIYASLGDRDHALAWLERIYDAREGILVYLAVQPQFDGLRGEPRFQALVARVGLPR
ncbi:protein kinase (plasmid) [Gemmatirosa kalamazoonensis]|uniref:non-specific serine/threonine protein kinase n=2 Tax=Gemmatirosa kalamazoonensis TaxID=861299 RepID=W0RSY3_9BACT|nr:protein kinase [Gemmatirosa kalamazoonensis]